MNEDEETCDLRNQNAKQFLKLVNISKIILSGLHLSPRSNILLRKKAWKRGDMVKTMRNDQAASFVCQIAHKCDNRHCITDPDEMHQDKRVTLLQRLGYRRRIRGKTNNIYPRQCG